MGKWRYGVILDAGSSGTRCYVYRWLNSDLARDSAKPEQLASLPAIESDKKWTKKIHPGISTFGDDPHAVGPDHLDKLLSFALKHVPLEEVHNTPLFLLATAGMRILPERKQKSVLKEVCDFTRRTTQFQLPDCDKHIQVISGETEGLYGWIAANYLLGGFDQPKDHQHGKGHHTYGFLDMGGASAQIAFAPNATEAEKHANDLTLLRLRTIGGTPLEYKVFVTTWLGFGANKARERYVEALVESSPKSKELPDPCLPSGLMVNMKGEPITSKKTSEPHLLGTGQFTECLHQTYPLLEKEKECLDMPCLINGQHVPAIDFDVNHFVGVSEYWHTTHEIFEMGHKDKAYDFKTYQTRVNEFCNQDWTSIEKSVEKHKWGKKVDAKTAQEVCFKASWLINMLHDGIGVPRVGLEESKGKTNTTKQMLESAKSKGFLDPFQAVDKIDDAEVSWTLGKMVLYASSEIAPESETKALAVGFGSNEPGIPKDFQFPGGTYHPYISGSSKSNPENDDWHDKLLSSNSHRIPGFIIFVLILFIIGLIACGKERRKSFFHKITHPFGGGRKGGSPRYNSPRSRRPKFPASLFSRLNQQPYERVLEEGDINDFELGPIDSSSDHEHSSDSDDGHKGMTSGWVTPQIHGHGAPPGTITPNYFDSVPGRDVMSDGANLMGLRPPSAPGLLLRTDSKERLARGKKSRTSSPSRLRTPMPLEPWKESVE